jgi:hypothetical protein
VGLRWLFAGNPASAVLVDVTWFVLWIWITVRGISRRERWAVWTAIGMGIWTVVYPASHRPIHLTLELVSAPDWAFDFASWFYDPLVWGLEAIKESLPVLLPILAVSVAALCVWLTVRILNRKERWAKWTLVTVVGLPVLYVASIGPWFWLDSSGRLSPSLVWMNQTYDPIHWIAERSTWANDALSAYLSLWLPARPKEYRGEYRLGRHSRHSGKA